MEQDIQNLIQMNRITRLVHKARFLPRQRYLIDFSRKYVITAADIAKRDEKAMVAGSRSP